MYEKEHLSLRYVLLASDVIWEMLPDYKEHDPPARDALDVYISHRTLMEQRAQQVKTIFIFWLVINQLYFDLLSFDFFLILFFF